VDKGFGGVDFVKKEIGFTLKILNTFFIKFVNLYLS